MKKMYQLLALLLIAFMNNGFAQPVTVVNGGFETGIVEGWGFDIGGGAEGSWEEETADIQEGAKALKVYVDALGSDPWSMQFKNEHWEVANTKSYMLSIWAKDISEGEDIVLMNFTCGMTNGVDTWTEGTRLGDHPLTKEWAEYKIYFTPAAASIEAGLYAYMSLHLVHIGVAIFDNFTITETQTKEASIIESGSKISIEFIQTLSDPTGNETNFSVTVDGAANPVTAIGLDAVNTKLLELTLTNAIAAGKTAEVTYTPGTLATTSGTEITGFTLIASGSDVGIKENQDFLSAAIYPNPTKGMIYMDGIQNARSIEIYNIVGKLVKSELISTAAFDASDLNTGVYFAIIKNDQGISFANSFVIE